MKEKLDDCVCKMCGLQWPCAAAVKRHTKAHKTGNTEISRDYVHIWGEVEDELATEEDITEAVENMDENMPIITDINTHMKSPFEEI